jgi:hypothetical protein
MTETRRQRRERENVLALVQAGLDAVREALAPLKEKGGPPEDDPPSRPW